ncbi:MAG: hypothetical protein M1822_003710 [Bathelium mastoideum]|nr:MAG: hypothetical protein M1822_003710 [Bathelium mastoideum]
MADSAVASDINGTREHTGLSILDLTKHAARTIVETLKEEDRLGIVTFGYTAETIQELTAMTDESKKQTLKRIEKLQPNGATNLWHGLQQGRKLFPLPTDEISLSQKGKTQAMFVLTDGQPNYMCPSQGYVPKLKPILEKEEEQGIVPPSIHTFGFGYSLRSGLLQSIAEIGGGNYAFIPDAGMIGTVFVHAMANLYSTFAKGAILKIGGPLHTFLEDASSNPVAEASSEYLTIPLGNLQYGQSRDMVFTTKVSPDYDGPLSATVKLSYMFNGRSELSSSVLENHLEDNERSGLISPEILQYHVCRAKMCNFLNGLFPMKPDGEHSARSDVLVEGGEAARLQDLRQLTAEIQQNPAGDTELLKSLLQDLDGASPQGQVRIALQTPAEFMRWGQHYLPSLLHAHTRQVCNSFKDPGPLQYGTASPVFQRCRRELDAAFDSLPPPKPSIKPRRGQKFKKVSSMSHYNRSQAPCFAAGMMVRLGNVGQPGSDEKPQSMPVEDLKPGTLVWTPKGPRKVQALVETIGGQMDHSYDGARDDFEVCRVGDLLVTPWHPVLVGERWTFPADLTPVNRDRTTQQGVRAVYSVILEEDVDIDAHAIEIQGVVAVTLGHGMTKSESGDIRAHTFFGDHAKVLESIQKLKEVRPGVMRCGGMQKSAGSGLATGFEGSSASSERLRSRKQT